MILSEANYIQNIKSLLPDEGEVAVEVLELMEKAVADYPDNAKLWCWRGDLIQMASLEANYELDDALKSYERALEIDPLNAEAYESIGYYEDVIMSNPTSAETPFRKAIELGAGRDSFYGLARVLAELNKNTEALEVISPENCPYFETKEYKKSKPKSKKACGMTTAHNKSMDVRAKQRLCFLACPLNLGWLGGGFAPRHLNRYLHTNLRGATIGDRTNKPSNATCARIRDICREFQKCSNSSNSRDKNFRQRPHSTNCSKVSAASGTADSECVKTANRRFPIRAFPESVFQNLSRRGKPLSF